MRSYDVHDHVHDHAARNPRRHILVSAVSHIRRTRIMQITTLRRHAIISVCLIHYIRVFVSP